MIRTVSPYNGLYFISIWIAQFVERRHVNPEVVGSNPALVNSLFKPTSNLYKSCEIKQRSNWALFENHQQVRSKDQKLFSGRKTNRTVSKADNEILY